MHLTAGLYGNLDSNRKSLHNRTWDLDDEEISVKACQGYTAAAARE